MLYMLRKKECSHQVFDFIHVPSTFGLICLLTLFINGLHNYYKSNRTKSKNFHC